MSLFHRFDECDAPAIVLSSTESISYRELARLSDEATSSLDRDDLIAVEFDNSLDSLLVYLGALRRGVRLLPIDATLRDTFKSALLDHYQVSVQHSRGSQDSSASQRFVRRRRHGPRMHADIALLLSTSGSTGSPKLVRLSHNNIESNAGQIAAFLELDETSRAISSLPLHYSFGLSILHSHLYAGGSLTLTASAVTEKRFWDLFESTSVNSLSGVPVTFEILKKMRFERMPLTNLRTLTQAGGRLNPKTVEHFAVLAAKSGWRFYVMYGQTEATARMSFLRPELVQSTPSSIGTAIPGGRFEIVSEDHVVVDQPRVAGQLVYYGPNVMLGYAESVEDLGRGDDLNGRLQTGDLAELDEQGMFYITGRINRFIKVLGLRYNLDEIESQLQSDGFNVVVVGREDRIFVASAKEVELEAAVSRLCESTGLRPSVVSTISVAEIPRSSSGKVQYAELLRLDTTNHNVSA